MAKERLVLDKVTGAVPVPVNVAVCGEFGALSPTVRVPVRVPAAVGVKVTEIVQLALAASVAGAIGHIEVRAKLPEIEIAAIARGAV